MDKQSLYGDPGLVPTRQGEAFRRELAVAGEIEAAVGVMAGVQDVRATVREGNIGISVRAEPWVAQSELRQGIEHLVEAAAGPESVSRLNLVVTRTAVAPTAPSAPISWGLALGLLGLGASLGIMFDRLLRRSRPSSR